MRKRSGYVVKDGKVWEVSGTKLTHPIPVELLDEKFMDRYLEVMRNAVKRKCEK